MSLFDQPLDDVVGNEALTVGEKIGTFFKEVSRSIDSFNAEKFNGTIHAVKGIEIFTELEKSNNYFKVGSTHIPASVFFNDKAGTFADYVTTIMSTSGLLKIVTTETQRIYQGLKETAAKGNVSFKLRHWDLMKEVDSLDQKIAEQVTSNNPTTRSINVMYKSFSSAKTLLDNYNKSVETIKSRDPEMLSKYVDDVIEMMKLLKRKIDTSDIKIDQDGLLTIDLAINRLTKAVNLTGRMLGLLNNLTRTFELQIAELKKLK